MTLVTEKARDIGTIPEVADGEEFQRLKAAHIGSLNMTPTFELLLSDGSQADFRILVERAVPIGFTLSLDQSAADRLGAKPGNPELYLADTKGSGVSFQYPLEQRDGIESFLQRRSNLLATKRREALVIPEGDRSPKSIDPDVAARILAQTVETNLSHVTFCTGAGMSYRAGFASIDDNESFGSNMGFRDRDFDSTKRAGKINDTFVQQLLAHQETAENVLSHYELNQAQAFRDGPTTFAHAAIADLIRAFELRPGLITSNHDMFHEADGSRLRPARSRRAWEVREIPGLDEAEEAVRDEVRRAIKPRAEATTLIVATGMSSDSHGVMGYIRSQHYKTDRHQLPIIMAINERGALPYLGRDDFLVQGEANNVLAEIAHLVIPGWHPVSRARREAQR